MICPCQSLSGFSGKVLRRGEALSFWGCLPLCFAPGHGGTAFTGQQGPQRTALCPSVSAWGCQLLGHLQEGRLGNLGHHHPRPHPHLQPAALLVSTSITGMSLPWGENLEKRCSLTNPLAGSKSFTLASFGNTFFSPLFAPLHNRSEPTGLMKTLSSLWKGERHNLCPLRGSILRPASSKRFLGPKVRLHLVLKDQR